MSITTMKPGPFAIGVTSFRGLADVLAREIEGLGVAGGRVVDDELVVLPPEADTAALAGRDGLRLSGTRHGPPQFVPPAPAPPGPPPAPVPVVTGMLPMMPVVLSVL